MSDKLYYKCTSCGYKFTRDRELAKKICPYCGKSTVTADTKNAAQNIIDDALRFG